ncbi:hypothetical protein D3C87_1139860 [compost metagenome]
MSARRCRWPDAVGLPAGQTQPDATGCAADSGRRDRRRLPADADAGRHAAAHLAGTGHRSVLHAGSLPHQQRTRSAAFRPGLASGDRPPRSLARIVLLERRRRHAASYPQAGQHADRVPRLERHRRSRAGTEAANLAQDRARGRVRSSQPGTVPLAPDPRGCGALLVHDEQPPHPHRCLVPFAADERFLRNLQRPRRRP